MSEIWIQGGIGIVALGVLYKVATFVISTVFERLIAHFDNTNATFKSHLDMLHAEHKDERQEMRKIHQDDRISRDILQGRCIGRLLAEIPRQCNDAYPRIPFRG